MLKITRVVLVDDHPLTSEGIAATLSNRQELEVVAQFDSAITALPGILELKPDLVVSDLNLGDQSGVRLMKTVRESCPELPFLILSMHDEDAFAERAIRAGARGYLMKSEGTATLLEAIETVISGKIYVSSRLSNRIKDNIACTQGEGVLLDSLTDRELEVLMAIGRGRSTKEIASDLDVGPKTIETHKQRIKTKLGFADALALMKFAVELQYDL